MNEHVHSQPRRRRSEPGSSVWTLPGFGPMTRISASFGDIPAQALRERDTIRTQQGTIKSVAWIDRVRLDSAFLELLPDAQPILIRSGALGNGLPKADVVLSPEQPISLGRHAHDLSFVKARDLCGRPGVLRKPEDMMTYTRFHCGESVCVRVEGLWAMVDPTR